MKSSSTEFKKNRHNSTSLQDNDNTTVDESVNTNSSQAEQDKAAEPEISELESLRQVLDTKDEEIANEKKEYMFLMAEFDNFRKRTMRERAELIKNASEKTLQGLLPIVDDFERGLDAIKDSSDADTVKEGMVLIYNKLIKYLDENGVKPMVSTGINFDPEIHEAVAMVPADDETSAGMIKDTVQKGYTINDKVLRHAKVVVAQ